MKIKLTLGMVLLSLGLIAAGCGGERGEWMKEEAISTEGTMETETRGGSRFEVEQTQFEETEPSEGT